MSENEKRELLAGLRVRLCVSATAARELFWSQVPKRLHGKKSDLCWVFADVVTLGPGIVSLSTDAEAEITIPRAFEWTPAVARSQFRDYLDAPILSWRFVEDDPDVCAVRPAHGGEA
jgi:hypothetical protein